MKKCLIMFALLVTTLILAALTERRQESVTIDDLVLEKKLSEDIAFEHTRSDQNGKTKDH